MLDGLRAHGLLKGRNLGTDSSDMEANASLSGLVRRNTEESYRDYVRNLARAAGVDADDPAAVARFDRRREGRETSNAEWYNPLEPDAKVGRTKHGACNMLHNPEHMVDLDSGAIVAAEVRPGDASDSEDLSTRVIEVAELVEDLHVQDPEQGASRVKSFTAEMFRMPHPAPSRVSTILAEGPQKLARSSAKSTRAAASFPAQAGRRPPWISRRVPRG